MTTYRLFPSTNGPSAASGYSGPFQAGVAFQVTQGGQWLDGYWWWVAATGQQVSAVTAALWQFNAPGPGGQVLVPNSGVTSGTLTAGAWNYIPLPAPIALSQFVAYEAVIGYQSTTGFPFTANQFGSGQPFAAGIVNGPLSAFSDQSGSAPAPASQAQGNFGTGSASGASASANFPGTPGGDLSANFWVDVQIDSVAPGGAAYQIWPSQPFPVNQAPDTANNFTLGTEFTLSNACALNEILFYSQAGVTQLPTECGIWTVPGASLVPGTHLTSPAWSGAAGSGWVSVSYAGVTLPAGEYKVTVFNGAASPQIWNATTGPNYWASPGPGANGITNGPVSAPNNASATSPGQSSYHQSAAFQFPDTNVGPYTYWVDVLVTPTAFSGTGTATAALTATSTGIARLTGERQLVRKAVAGYFGGALVTTDAGTCYQGGPLTAYGLGTAYPYTVRHVPDEYYTQGQPDGQNWGMVMSTTRLERVTARDSYGGATSGWRSRRYAVECEIALVCELPHIEVAGAALDDLIDAMFGLLAQDRNLGTKAAYQAGTSLLLIIQAGEGKGGQGGPGFRDLTEKFQEIDAEKGRYAALATVSFEAFTMVAS